MFDIGFWELMIIGIISLVVLGPERLPVAIRSVRKWVNSVRDFSNSVKTELKEELRVHELHENLRKAETAGMKNLSPEIAESVKSLKEAADMVNRPYEINLNDKPDATKTVDDSAQANEASTNKISSEQAPTSSADHKAKDN